MINEMNRLAADGARCGKNGRNEECKIRSESSGGSRGTVVQIGRKETLDSIAVEKRDIFG